MNEMLGMLAQQEEIPEEGLKELVFDYWQNVSEPLDSSVLQSLANKCLSLRSLKLSYMHNLPAEVKMQLAGFAETIQATETLRKVNFSMFSYVKDAGEGAVLLTTLACSPSLPSITHFNCRWNSSWFSEEKKNNTALLSQVIKGMTSVQNLNMECIWLSTEEMCDQVISAIVACQQANPDLKTINLINTGVFSDSAKAQVADLKAKGVEIHEA